MRWMRASMNDTIDQIREAVRRAEANVKDVNALKNDVPLTEQGLDSLDMFNVFLELEDLSGIRVPDEHLEELRTIDDIAAYVSARLSKEDS
jgi:acyl carrier protein